MKWSIPSSDDNPDLTPMIDIVFLLIVFFMTVANVITAEKVDIEVPIASQAAVPETQQNRETISVSEDGSFYLGAAEAGLDHLKTAVAAGVSRNPNYQVLIRADANTPFRYTQEVMNVCAEAGATNIVFTTFQGRD